jgi:putative aminopeptidase FrvX
MLDRRHLLRLLACHSTPGDEAEVRALLEQAWQAAGLVTRRLGDYALTATLPATGRRRPVLLITAHMDSPGFAVDRLPAARGARRNRAGLTRLGGAAFPGQEVAGVLKTRSGKTPVLLRKKPTPGGEPDFSCAPAPAQHLPPDLRHGDRVCFASSPHMHGDTITAPFLDNRLGCWLLSELAPHLHDWQTPWQVVLAATGSEEFGGFGASVLAGQVRADLVIVLDATYASRDQQVVLGGGPVLTLSDASVLLSSERRDQVMDLLAAAGIPLQTEVYNFSGTDARAFPRMGQTCPVLPLLLPTTGNHSPREAADLRDADHLLAALLHFAATRPAELGS